MTPISSVPAAKVEVSAEIAAVIAAAVALTLGRPHRVVSMHYIGVPEARFNVWAQAVGPQNFGAHKFHRPFYD